MSCHVTNDIIADGFTGAQYCGVVLTSSVRRRSIEHCLPNKCTQFVLERDIQYEMLYRLLKFSAVWRMSVNVVECV